MTQDFNNRFDALVHDHFGAQLADSGLDTVLADLELDSLGLLDFVMSLEQGFDVEIDVEVVNEDMTLMRIREVLRDLAGDRSAAAGS
ncbi:acyl carrier protein [Pseudazoarcus pumilus]|uniref:Carrier domain-containing protein n=1 Tax=Pseudazoarcus pumilus TaxID=2067960 RepID=A0A2I6S8B7_9RHOO|nr:acyl carrier protein [Pseudazoarcus pumilus]AUN95509.1 hypothetical protein C0099_11570 [Pseudazoarcus pumilus]